MAPRKRSVAEVVEDVVTAPAAKKTKKETATATNVAAAKSPKSASPKPKVIAAKAATKATTKAAASNKQSSKEDGEDEFGVYAMKVAEIKEKLKERDLSTNGDKKVISKRLIERLVKEKDPSYKPKPKGRFCKECVVPTLMQKRNGVRGPFFGCANYPQCMYTENRGSMAMLGKPKWFDINAPR